MLESEKSPAMIIAKYYKDNIIPSVLAYAYKVDYPDVPANNMLNVLDCLYFNFGWLTYIIVLFLVFAFPIGLMLVIVCYIVILLIRCTSTIILYNIVKKTKTKVQNGLKKGIVYNELDDILKKNEKEINQNDVDKLLSEIRVQNINIITTIFIIVLIITIILLAIFN